MDKETYYELSNIEDILFEINNETGWKERELSDSWSSLFSYLKNINTDDLE